MDFSVSCSCTCDSVRCRRALMHCPRPSLMHMTIMDDKCYQEKNRTVFPCIRVHTWSSAPAPELRGACYLKKMKLYFKISNKSEKSCSQWCIFESCKINAKFFIFWTIQKLINLTNFGGFKICTVHYIQIYIFLIFFIASNTKYFKLRFSMLNG